MGIGMGEGLVLLLIAALFLRGDEFATVARKAGQWMGQAQRMSRSFMQELQREADRTGLEESTREIRKAVSSAKSARPGAALKSWLEPEQEADPEESRDSGPDVGKPEDPATPAEPPEGESKS